MRRVLRAAGAPVSEVDSKDTLTRKIMRNKKALGIATLLVGTVATAAGVGYWKRDAMRKWWEQDLPRTFMAGDGQKTPEVKSSLSN